MSSKASEILGVSSGHPQLSRRRDVRDVRDVPSRDGVASRASHISRYTSNTMDSSFDSDTYAPSSKRPRTGKSRLHKSERNAAPSSKTSIDSMQPSVRFADSSLSSQTSTSTLRNATDCETALPEISRRPPSAWRGLSSRGSSIWKPVSARQSEESISSRHTNDGSDQGSKNRSLLQSALSRLTLRSPKSRASVRDQSSKTNSTVSTARSSAASSAMSSATPSAYGSAYATPRALSPTRPVVSRADDSYSSRASENDTQGRKPKRLNSRMPVDAPRHIDVHRPTSRNWVDELDDLDVDDGPAAGRYVAEDALYSTSDPRYPPKASRDFAQISQMDYGNAQAQGWNQKRVYDPNYITGVPRQQLMSPVNGTSTQKSKRRSIESAKKYHSKRSANLPSSHSILSLSDSDGDGSVILRETGETYRQTIRSHRKGYSNMNSFMVPNDVGKAPKNSNVANRESQRQTYKAPAAILSVLRLEDEREDSTASTSLPSLVESGSSRQNSSISTTSRSRSFVSDSQQVLNFSVPRRQKMWAKGERSSHVRSPTNDSSNLHQDSEINEERRPISVIAAPQNDSIEAQPSSDGSGKLIMASISHEEAALLAHIRRQRAHALNQLQPQSPAEESPVMLNKVKPQVLPAENDEQPAEISEASGLDDVEIEVDDEAGDASEASGLDSEEEEEEEEEEKEEQEPAQDQEEADETITLHQVMDSREVDHEPMAAFVSEHESEQSQSTPNEIVAERATADSDTEPLDAPVQPADTVYDISYDAETQLPHDISGEKVVDDYESEAQQSFNVSDEKIIQDDIKQQSVEEPGEEGHQNSFSSNEEYVRDEYDQAYSAESMPETPVDEEESLHTREIIETPKPTSNVPQSEEESTEAPAETSSPRREKPSPLQAKPPPPMLLHQRQRSIAYREARSKFEQASQNQPKTSMLPVRRKRNSLTSNQNGSPAGNVRPVKELSQIPRLRDSKSASPRPSSVIKSADKLASFHVSDSSSGDAIGTQNFAPDYFSQNASSKGAIKEDIPARVYAAESEGSRFESNSSREILTEASNGGPSRSLMPPETPSEATSADDGDDEMAGSALAPISSIPRPVNRNSGARHVLEAWHALGGAR